MRSHKLHRCDFFHSLIWSALFLAFSLVVNFYAAIYATESASNSVTDIILSNIRIFDVDTIFVYGPLIFIPFVLILLLRKPQEIPYTLKSVSLFVLIRSAFITLTHIGPYPTPVVEFSDIARFFIVGGDLFFSGHTGLPFLMALIFWENFRLRVFFISIAIFFGIIVLAGHLHYSIDVLAAFFITHTIDHIAEKLFKKDREMFYHGIQTEEKIFEGSPQKS
ncbi:hypothetical protein HZA38_00940 [Candidatus Peregrinibacteria bacterium]|nr:hypothetical protein [Candidatus Peregrinibacteria bacterium]